MDRRTFIAVGTAAIAGLTTTGLSAQPGPTRIVSVGFRPYVSRTRAVGNARGTGLFDATSVTFSEPSFMRTGARFSIRGMQRGSSTPLSFVLDVHHPADDVEGKVVFHAWAIGSNRLSFNVPVELERTVDIAVTIGKARHVFPFTVGSVEGALKLNPGKYIFAVGDRTPSWSALRMENDVLKTLDGSAVDFDYVVVSVSTPS